MSLFDSGIRPVLDQWLVDEAAKTRDYGKYWSASSAGYCQRKLIFQRLGVPPVKPPDARKERVFTAGKLFHDWIQKLTREAGLSVAQEVELEDTSLMIRGHFDDLVLVTEPTYDVRGRETRLTKNNKLVYTTDGSPLPPPKQNLILYDYKTVNSRSFTYSKSGEMSYYHKMQLGTYMYMLRKWAHPYLVDPRTGEIRPLEPKSELTKYDLTKLTEARILKISKDDLRQEEQQLMWSDDLAKEVIDYWTVLNRYWLDKKIPPCTCADHENGFLAREAYNDYFYEGEPCSLKYYQEWKAKKEQTK